MLCLLAAGSALAQSAPPPATTTPSASAAEADKAGDTKDDDKKDDDTKDDDKKEGGSVNARLAPGGVVTGGSSFPLHIQATLDNSLGNAIFAPGYQQQVVWGTSLSLRMSAMLPKADWAPRMLLSGGTDFSINNLVPASSNPTAYDRQIQLGDASLALIMPGLYTEAFTGISVSLITSARAPLSLASRQNNLMFGLGAAAQFMWNSPETPIGSFFVQYTPSVRVNTYSQVGATIPCSAAGPFRNVSSADPIDGITELPMYFGRAEQVLDNGECILPGRQSLASVSNSMATGWSTADGSHNVSLSLAWAHAFLRPLKNDPSLSSPFASGQNFGESNSGSVSYTYTVPVDFNMFLTGGIFSQQPVYNDQGQLRFPLWDFVTPANNLSGFFFDVTVGI
jgi:hypothetical protein